MVAFARLSWQRSCAVVSLLCLAVLGSALAAKEPGFSHGSWPFLPLARPAVPVPEDAAADWARTPVDRFILARLQAAGLQPSAEADRATLLRRVKFDLLGLPPTPEELAAFLADESPDAYERLVDRLLESPHYGERWAQHWLDLVRYADTAGFKSDEVRPMAHMFRDYVIRAYNRDLPYDDFVRQQIAGDELDPDNPDAMIATGLYRLGPMEWNASNFMQSRQSMLDDVTEVTSLAFLGITLGCAKCHDHKFDPIAQTDYFRLQACFAGLLPRDDLPVGTAAERADYEARLAQWDAMTDNIRDQMDALTKSVLKQAIVELADGFDAATRDALLTPEEKRDPLQRELCALTNRALTRKCSRAIRRMEGEPKQKYDELQTLLTKYDQMRPTPLPMPSIITDVDVVPPPTFVLDIGDYRKPGQRVEPGFPEFLGRHSPRVTPARNATSSGRRAALAQWLTAPEHPLTARVFVNRVWQHHLGRGIVASPNDFGAMGDSPTHPELLDWLAAEFVGRDWSLKHLHRLILTSAVYRQASHVDPRSPAHIAALKADGDNRLLWHARRRRLDGEAIRDAILHISGELLPVVQGPTALPRLPPIVQKNSRYAWTPGDKPADNVRRSVYVIMCRGMREPLLGAFDAPDLYASCAVRNVTVTATQSLHLLNGEFALTQARSWAGRLLSQHATFDRLVAAAFTAAYGRVPDSTEVESAVEFLREQANLIGAGEALDSNQLPTTCPPNLRPAQAAAVVDFCHAVLNSSELQFVE